MIASCFYDNRVTRIRRRLVTKIAFATLALFACGAPQAWSAETDDDAKPIYYVEEHWEIVLGDPDPLTNSPQISFFLFPDSRDDSRYFELQMNYAADPGGEHDAYSSGGFRVTSVVDGIPHQHRRSENHQRWTSDQDRIRWTSVVAAYEGQYRFAIKNGSAGDWGEFGGPEYLVELPTTSDTALAFYHPGVSVSNVDIGFGKNRVHSVRLRGVTVVYRDGSRQNIVRNDVAHGMNAAQ